MRATRASGRSAVHCIGDELVAVSRLEMVERVEGDRYLRVQVGALVFDAQFAKRLPIRQRSSLDELTARLIELIPLPERLGEIQRWTFRSQDIVAAAAVNVIQLDQHVG